MSKDSGCGQLHRVVIAILTIVVAVSQPAAVISVTADETASLTIDVKVDGEQATEVNSLVIYQDRDWSDPYQKIENYESVDLKHVFSDLPGGHEYLVSAYIQDQPAGNTGWIELNGGESAEREINAEERHSLTVRAVHEDGSTPLEGARMTIKSHESYKWREGTTGSSGYAHTPDGGDDFYLYPPGDADDSSYYTVEIHHGGEVVGSQRIDSLDSSDSIEVETSVPVTYDLSVSSTEGGDVDAERTGAIEAGTEVDLKADDDDDHAFVEWDGDLPAGVSESDDDITVTMDQDRDIEAKFAEEAEVSFKVMKANTVDGYDFSGEPVEDARLTLDGATRESDDEGDVSFANLAPGTYSYTADAAGYETITGTFELSEGESLIVPVNLPRQGVGGLTVNVVNRNGDEVAANKYRVLVDGERRQLDRDGGLLLDEGTYDVTVEPTDFGSDELTEVSKMVTVEAGEGTTVRMTPFETQTYSLDVNVPENGSINIIPPDTSVSSDFSREYDEGTEVTISAQSDVGYRFNGWDGAVPNPQKDEQSVTVTISQDLEVTPQFQKREIFSNDPTVKSVANAKAQSGLVMGYNETSISKLNQERYVESRQIQVAKSTMSEHGNPVFLQQSNILTGGYYVTSGKAASQRTSGALYDGTFETRHSGSHKVTITPDFRIHSGVTVTDIFSYGGGGGSTALSYKIRLINTTSDELVATKSGNVVGNNYPTNFDPSNDGRWGAIAEDAGMSLAENSITDTIMTKLGLAAPIGTLASFLLEGLEESLSDKYEYTAADFNRPITLNADLKSNQQYRIEFLLIGDTRTAAEERGYAFETRAILNTYGDVSQVDVEPIAETTLGGEETPPVTQITDGPTNIASSDTVEYTWEGIDANSDAGQLEYSFRLRGLEDSWSPWTTDTTAVFNDLPEGQYTFEVRARDEDGNVEQVPTKADVTIASVPEANISITEESLDSGETIQLRATNTETQRPPESISYEWIQLDGPTDVSRDLSNSRTVEFSTSEPGEYVIRLIVSAGRIENQTTAVIQVGDAAPTVLDYSVSPAAPVPDETVTLRAEATDPDGTIQSYEWDFDGDGTIDATTQTPEAKHTYTNPAEYTGELIITDDDGNQASSTWVIQVGEDQDDNDPDETLLKADFENTPVGQLPSGWTKIANRNQEVIDSPVANGDRALQLKGSHGGCWEAIADRETELPNSGTTEISFSIRPTTNGEIGCHDHNGAVKLNTETGSWSAGSGSGLVVFTPDGTVAGSGTDLGSYQIDAWNDVTIRYARSGGEVTLTYFINGERRGTTTRDARSFENALSYLRVKSGDFTTQVDDVEIERVDDNTAGDSTPTAERRDFTGDGTEDIRIRNGEIFLQIAGENVSGGRQVADVVGRDDDRRVLDRTSALPNNPYSTGKDRPTYESTSEFKIVAETDRLASYRVVRNYSYEHTGARVQIAWQATVFADGEYALTQLNITNIDTQPVELDQDDGDIHDGIQLFHSLRLAGRDGTNSAYRFQIGDQSPQQFSQTRRWTTSRGTEHGTIFDGQNAATVRFLTGKTSPHQWITDGEGQIGYHVGETVVAPGETISWTAALAVHEGGQDAPTDGEALVADADERVDEIPSGSSASDNGPVAEFDIAPSSPTAGASITFDASGASDADGTIERYKWDFNGDGTIDETAAAPTVSHTYDEPGQYDVALTVVDDEKKRSTTNRVVEVTQQSDEETSIITAVDSQAETAPGTAVRLSYTVVNPTDGTESILVEYPDRPANTSLIDVLGDINQDLSDASPPAIITDPVPAGENATVSIVLFTSENAAVGTYPVTAEATIKPGNGDVTNATTTAEISIEQQNSLETRFGGSDETIGNLDVLRAVNAANTGRSIGGEPVTNLDVLRLVNHVNQ
ncbi:PKD domain-containing protein (plasmid) [Haloplanus ruber]|uniref:PKD domain-containing protein n=1 Tax=Haloplanus ruber TaxID=869892 RepID=A0ABD6D211_9EURY|nr:PKD domain-containing protein [Haloplanus ruber]